MQIKSNKKSKKLQLVHLIFPLTLGKNKGISLLSTLLQLFGLKSGLDLSVKDKLLLILHESIWKELLG